MRLPLVVAPVAPVLASCSGAAFATDLTVRFVDAFSDACLADLNDVDGRPGRLRRAGLQPSGRDSRGIRGDIRCYAAIAERKPKTRLRGWSIEKADAIRACVPVLKKLNSMPVKIEDATRERDRTTILFSAGRDQFEVVADDIRMGRPPNYGHIADLAIYRKN